MGKPTFQIGDQTFQHIGDLEYFDGTLIALFREQASGVLYVLHWVDVTEAFHRWVFFPVSARAMKLYLEGKLSNEDLFLLGSPETVWLIELNGDLQIGSVRNVPVVELPLTYRPTAEGFFDKPNCPDLADIQAVLETYPTERLRAKDAALLPTS